jgi:hypothetical protein
MMRFVPNYVCVLVNIVDRLITARGQGDRGVSPVAACGQLT